MGRHKRVITRDPSREAYISNSTDRELITLVETISGDGGVLAPIIILNRKQHQEHWYSQLPDNYQLGLSESGYSNDKLALEWLHHFMTASEKRQVGWY